MPEPDTGVGRPDAAATPAPHEPGPIGRLDRWKIARGIIEHEDNLVNHRHMWLLTLQGFLFAGISLGAANLASGGNRDHHLLLYGLMLCLCVVGGFTPILVKRGVMSAYIHEQAASQWWRQFGSLPDKLWSEVDPLYQFPPIRGSLRTPQDYPHEYRKKFHESRPDEPMPEHRIKTWDRADEFRSKPLDIFSILNVLPISWGIIGVVIISSAMLNYSRPARAAPAGPPTESRVEPTRKASEPVDGPVVKASAPIEFQKTSKRP